ncbi:extracellular calcium-sensing receptor-like [Rhinophrynus dorsalis]
MTSGLTEYVTISTKAKQGPLGFSCHSKDVDPSLLVAVASHSFLPCPTITLHWFFNENFQQFQAMRFALEEINKNPDFLPNITLGFHALDSCASLHKELEGTLWMLTGENRAIPNYCCQQSPPLAAVIGHSMSTYSILMAHILGLYRYPQISHFSTSSQLSDRTQFPSFFRTVPSDTFQSKGLAQLVLHFRWTWVGLVAVQNDYGQQGIQVVKQEILKSGGCVAFTEYILLNHVDKNVPYITTVIKKSTAKAVIVFSTSTYFIPLLDEMLKQNVTGKIFVASEAWVNRTTLWNNSTKLCTGNEDLESVDAIYNDISFLRSSYNIYISTYVIAKSLHNLHSCQEEKGPFDNGSCADIHTFKPWQLLHYMKEVHLKMSNGREVFFDINGDPPALYDIVNWQLGPDGTMKQIKVGSYDTAAADGNVFMINTSAIRWTSGQGQIPSSVCSASCPPGFRTVVGQGQPVCCFQCVPCPQGEISNHTDSVDCFRCPWDEWPNIQKDRCLKKTIEFLSYEEPLGAMLAGFTIISSMIPVSILGLFCKKKKTAVVRANNYSLSCLLLVSLFFCILCSLVFIGYPKLEKCILRQVAFGMVFALCVSCILAKTIMVFFAFMATKPGSNLLKWANTRMSYLMVFLCTFLQFFLCVSWIFIAPPFPEYNIQSRPGLIIVECNENSPVFFWCMLGYLGLLSTVSFIVAFLARGLPDSFNEAKFITFSMLAFLTVWVSFIPAYHSAHGQYSVAMEVFAILSSSWALLFCMFFPKCFIILFRPHMNSREHLMGKHRVQT